MVKAPAPPIKRPASADVSRPCLACRWHRATPWVRRLLGMGIYDAHYCLNAEVRGAWSDPVTGLQGIYDPVPCSDGRISSACNQSGHLWEPKDG